MGSIRKRDKRIYLRYVDNDGVERQRLARGATTIAEARPMLAEIERRIMRGLIGIEERIEETPEQRRHRTMTVEELGALFGESYTSSKVKDIDQYRREARNIWEARINPHLGTKRAAEVTTRDVDDLVTALMAEEYAGSSVRSATAVLSRAYVWARKMAHLACDNPVRGSERPATTSSLEFLARDEVQRFLGYLERLATCYAATPTARSLHAVVAFCVYTGARKGEAMGLRWQDLQLDAGRVDILRSYDSSPKSGKPRYVPLNTELVRILRAWRDRPDRGDDGGLVFPVAGRMGRREEILELGAAYDAARVNRPKKPWHALRHTFASHFMMSGGNILTLQKLLGHSTLTMTMIYAHLAPDFMVNEVARMSFAMASAGVHSMDEARRHRDDTEGHALVAG